MALDEKVITQAIVDRYFKKLKENLSVDVAVVGGGPSGLVGSYFLARKGFKVTLFERKSLISLGFDPIHIRRDIILPIPLKPSQHSVQKR
jgi:ribulose 1,5-bisphosphate synthetase/thiazole synthase